MQHQPTFQQPIPTYVQQPQQAPPQVTPAEIYVQQQAAFAMATCAVALQQQFVSSPPPRVTSSRTSSSICRTWAREGRCHCKGCPLAASHTAYNSPRYREHGVDSNPSSPRQADPPQRSLRANALLIVDPRQVESPQEEPALEEQPVEPVLEASAPVFAPPRPRSRKTTRPLSPNGSRLGKWLSAQ